MSKRLLMLIIPTIFLFSCLAHPTASNTPSPKEPSKTTPFDPQLFVEMAQKASCSDIKNELYIIDEQLVFWVKEGNCDDGSYAYILFGNSPQERLCYREEAFAVMEACQPAFEEMFDIILQNLDQADLGLGETHEVVMIELLSP